VRRREFLLDAGVTGVALAVTLGMLATGGFGAPDARASGLDGPGLLLAAGATLPLAARRIAPFLGYLVAAASSVALLDLGYPLDVPVGAMIAGYWLAVAYSGEVRALRRRGAMVAVAAFVPVVSAGFVRHGLDVWDIAPELLLWFAVFVGLWIAGDRTRLRRERIAELEELARRTAREAERERRLAAAEERTRIARELHDAAGHAINVILVQAGAARLLHRRDPEGSRRAITTIEDVARSTIGEIDRLVRALRDDRAEPPAPLDPSALGELVERHRAGGLAVASEIGGPRPALPHGVAWAAYRILQEALTNAARHGRGSADVAVWFGTDAVQITVTNPAAGGPVPAGGGHGIVGMRERASILGGSLRAEADNGLFRLQARLPHSEPAR
jgi:signal transduction histidine kinase